MKIQYCYKKPIICVVCNLRYLLEMFAINGTDPSWVTPDFSETMGTFAQVSRLGGGKTPDQNSEIHIAFTPKLQLILSVSQFLH